jgi:hypothetical protein
MGDDGFGLLCGRRLIAAWEGRRAIVGGGLGVRRGFVIIVVVGRR